MTLQRCQKQSQTHIYKLHFILISILKVTFSLIFIEYSIAFFIFRLTYKTHMILILKKFLIQYIRIESLKLRFLCSRICKRLKSQQLGQLRHNLGNNTKKTLHGVNHEVFPIVDR